MAVLLWKATLVYVYDLRSDDALQDVEFFAL